MENFKIIEQKENPLFKRKEIKMSIETEITPSHVEIEKLISEKFSASTENIKIKKISGNFGSKSFTITANIYTSKEDKENIEPKSKKDKAKEEKPVEAPIKEVKENKSEEAKSE